MTKLGFRKEWQICKFSKEKTYLEHNIIHVIKIFEESSYYQSLRKNK